MATIKDVAKETGLGLATISKYINGGNVREKNKVAIDAAIDRLGFTINGFARGLRTSKSRTIGVIIPELSNVFVTAIITAMEDVLRKNGYGVIICDCRTDEMQEREAVRFLMGKMVDGIVNMPVSRNGSHLLPLIEAAIPVVLVDRMIPGLELNVNAVLVDNVSASTLATQTLLDAGHKNIGIVLGPQDIFTSQQRLLGYYQVLIQNSLQPDASRVIFSDYTVQGGYESIKHLVSDKEITAIFVTNYEMTLGAMIAVNELGLKIPSQISLIGFDNMQLSQVINPRLTIITQPLEEIGEKSAEILLASLSDGKNRSAPTIVTLSPGISIGDSVEIM